MQVLLEEQLRLVELLLLQTWAENGINRNNKETKSTVVINTNHDNQELANDRDQVQRRVVGLDVSNQVADGIQKEFAALCELFSK